MSSPNYEQLELYRKCYKEIQRRGDAGELIAGQFSSIPTEFPTAWADDNSNVLLIVQAFGVTITDIGSGQHLYATYP